MTYFFTFRVNWFGSNPELGYNDVLVDLFYPVLQIELSGKATAQQTAQIRNNLYTALKLQTPLFYSAIGVGAAIFLIGLMVIYCGVKSRRESEYTKINN